MTPETAKAEQLIQQMEGITRRAETRGYMTSGERSLHASLEGQVRTIIKQQEREHMRLEATHMRQEMELGDLEAEIRELKDTRAFFQTDAAIKGRTTRAAGGGPGNRWGATMLDFPVERRQQSTVTGAAGAYLVPGFVLQVIEAAQQEDQILAAATTVVGDGKTPHYQPGFDDVAAMAQEVAQNASYSSGPDLLFRSDTLAKKSYRSGIFLASVEIMQDSNIDGVLAGALGRRAGRRLAKNLATALANAHAVTTAKTAVRDKLSDLMNGCRYAHNAGTAFMMHPSQLNQTILQGEVAGLKCVENISGNYYVHGKRVLLNPYLPSVQDSPTSSTVYFGVPARLVTITNSYRVARFNERWAEFGQVGFELLFQSSDALIATGSATDFPICKMTL